MWGACRSPQPASWAIAAVFLPCRVPRATTRRLRSCSDLGQVGMRELSFLGAPGLPIRVAARATQEPGRSFLLLEDSRSRLNGDFRCGYMARKARFCVYLGFLCRSLNTPAWASPGVVPPPVWVTPAHRSMLRPKRHIRAG